MATATATSIPTDAPAELYTQRCLELLDAAPASLLSTGKLVLSPTDYSPTYLANPLGGEETMLPVVESNGGSEWHVSPDSRWLAYRNQGGQPLRSEITIVGTDGQVTQTVAWEVGWRHISGWLDSENLLISQERPTPDAAPNPFVDKNDVLVLLNPFTGEQQTLHADFPSYRNVYPGPGWRWFNRSATIFNAALDRALYPQSDTQLALWIAATELSVRLPKGLYSYFVTPKWSPDDSVFLLAMEVLPVEPERPTNPLMPTIAKPPKEELYTLNRLGRLSRLTELSQAHSEVRFGDYAWSPDGRYVAFALGLEPAEYPDIYSMVDRSFGRLAVLDMETGSLTDYCVPVGAFVTPTWSPDGRQVVVENDDRSLSGNEVYLLDFDLNVAVFLGEDIYVNGWMIDAP